MVDFSNPFSSSGILAESIPSGQVPKPLICAFDRKRPVNSLPDAYEPADDPSIQSARNWR